MVGGFILNRNASLVEFLIEDFVPKQLAIKRLPHLPARIKGSSLALHNGKFLLCGGENIRQKCFWWNHGAWRLYSNLKRNRIDHSTVTTQTATFLFGGLDSPTTYEYLLKDADEWIIGKKEIPGGLYKGCAIAVRSEQEIWLIGGIGTEQRILSFNVKDHAFHVLPLQLNVGRSAFRCAFIPNTNKIMITGGHDWRYDYLDSTEIIDTEDGSVIMASPMNLKRFDHGMGTITINGEKRLAVFNTFIELYNTQTEQWENTDITFYGHGSEFGFLTVKLSDIISNF